MRSMPLLNERDFDLLIAYSLSGREDASRAVVNAFLAANIDVFERPTTLAEWIDPDALDDLDWFADRSLYLCALVWGHPVMVTAEEIRIYSPGTVGHGSGRHKLRERSR